MNIYGVYDGDHLIYKGTRGDVCTHYDIAERSIYEYIKGHRKLHGKFVIKRLDGIRRDEPVKTKSEAVKQDKFDYLLFHLKFYGNTIACFDPRPFYDRLKEKGVVCRHERHGKHFYIEVVR